MAKLLKLRGGTTSQHGSFTGADREVTIDTDKETLVVHDGSTAGGFTMMRSDVMQENLDVNGQSIVSASNGNIAITPNGSGKVVLDGLSYPTADGSAGQFLKTDGSGALSFASVELFPSGTSMLFQQTAAPTGWTKQTTHNDKSLRIVTGTVGTGGSVAFSTALGSGATVAGVSGNPTSNLSVSVSGNIANTTLSTSQIPSHTHPVPIVTPQNYSNTTIGGWSGPANSPGEQTNATGGGGSHNHSHNLSGSVSGNITAGNLAVGASTAAINVNYVDFIIANKD
mgnify:CR=1 FL=1